MRFFNEEDKAADDDEDDKEHHDDALTTMYSHLANTMLTNLIMIVSVTAGL